VAAVGDILQRFRFHGVPGAPAPAGVPVDRVREIEAELAPVFWLLEPAQQRVSNLLEEATADAVRRREESAEHAHRILAQARLDADSARAESAATRLARAERQSSALVAEARSEAQRIERVAAERTPALVKELVGRVLEMGEQVPPR
jgi:hypothetical protein